jgi:hypothetical protein
MNPGLFPDKWRHKMLDYFSMLDEAKARQVELAHEFESIRIRKEALRSRRSNSLATKVLTLLASLI